MTDIVRVEDEYYVRASSALADDRTRVLRYGETFAIFNRYGDIESVGPSPFGLFHCEARHLSRLTMQINQELPLLLSSTIREDNSFLAVDLTNIHGPSAAQEAPGRGTIHLFRLQFLRKCACYVSVRLLNHGQDAVVVSLTIKFDADFADIFEVRGTKRARKGRRLADEIDGNAAILGYEGLDHVVRRTRLEFVPAPATLQAGEANVQISLQPKEEKNIQVTISCERSTRSARPQRFSAAFESLQRDSERGGIGDCCINSSSESFNAWLARSTADLRMLIEGNPEGPYPYAGVPWFDTVFGRDGIITALECLWMAPQIAEVVLSYLAETQASEKIPEQDAEPGKIVHEIRRGEMAALKEVPFARYYGSVDATPLFVLLAGSYFSRTGNLGFVEKIWPNIQRALQWMSEYGDSDGDGFLEYATRSSRGLVQQGWKDSYDSIFHSDGRLAEPPIALCEVQGYVYAAKHSAAAIAAALGDAALAAQLESEAETLRRQFEEKFWSERLSTYAQALDGQKKRCEVRVSNAGHVLFCRLPTEERARRVAGSLMSGEMYSGWGVRTLGAGEARYNPMSYHNGSVWPHDNALISLGFSFYGLQEEACRVLAGLYNCARQFELSRMPELFCGFHKRPDGSGPTHYPVACSPQAWAAGSVFLGLQACLGLEVRAREPQIQVSNPHLPDGVDELRILNLQVGESGADICLRRGPAGVEFEVSRKVLK